jgi:hypothetical protein
MEGITATTLDPISLAFWPIAELPTAELALRLPVTFRLEADASAPEAPLSSSYSPSGDLNLLLPLNEARRTMRWRAVNSGQRPSAHVQLNVSPLKNVYAHAPCLALALNPQSILSPAFQE